VGASALVLIGALYVTVISLWLAIERTPWEPIGDPYLACMEVLTIVSALALIGTTLAVRCFVTAGRRGFATAAVVTSVVAAAVTISLHVRQLTLVRDAWRAGLLPDYRLVWPSRVLAVEYVVWDLLVGSIMLCVSAALWHGSGSLVPRRSTLVAGVLCLLGGWGPLAGHMLLQDIAVSGYAVVLPASAVLMARAFFARAPADG
jgi:hypothetical protein